MEETSAGRFSSRDRGVPTAWVVVIEATAGPASRPYDFECVGNLLFRLADWNATGLYCADRYAVQMEVEAPGCADALRLATAVHRQAADDLAMTPPVFLRAEVLTPEVLRRQWDAQGVPMPRIQDRMVPTRVYEATRAVLQAATAAEIRGVVADFVADNGGSVALAGPPPGVAGWVNAGMGLGPGEDIYTSVEALSVGGMLIEEFLPLLVDDARFAFQRLRRQPEPR